MPATRLDGEVGRAYDEYTRSQPAGGRDDMKDELYGTTHDNIAARFDLNTRLRNADP